MRLLATSGSLRANSANTSLIRAAARLAPEQAEVTIYDGLAELPHFNVDLDGDDPPAPVVRFRTLVGEADAVLISTPEYVHGMPGVLKNALDWTASSGEFVNKPTAAMSASPSAAGGSRAHASLVHTLTTLSADVVKGGTLTVPQVRAKLTSDGEVSDAATVRALRSVLDALAESIAVRTSSSAL